MKIVKNLFLVSLLILFAMPLYGAKRLTYYCSTDIPWCELMKKEFEKRTGIRVSMTRASSGETLTKIRAEKSNPKGDVWWGGTGDPHLQAAEEGLSQAYNSPKLSELHDWAKAPHKATGGKTVGIYLGALGYGYNRELLAKKGLPAPKCWHDLLHSAYRDEIQVANPNTSGTSYTTLATLVQLLGEEGGFSFLKNMHKNINQYTKSGSAPIKSAARGENAIGIVFIHDAVTQTVKGMPIKAVAPCEGTGYEIGSMSIIKGARNLDSAKKWVDFALTADVQSLAVKARAYQVPSNKGATVPPEAPDVSSIKLIDYDHGKYGSKAERTRLLAKWDREVKVLPR
ncbi:MAG: ABC transporter substrate-binding protein [bacterium]